MTKYLATINVPGYLPTDDDPPTFDTAHEAWEYLRGVRERGEQDTSYADLGVIDGHNGEFACAMSPCYHELDKYARWAASGLVCDFEAVGTVSGDTPGYEGDHDLGLAYNVTITED